jgi:hypothetical protein
MLEQHIAPYRPRGKPPVRPRSYRSVDYAADNGRVIRQTYLPVSTGSSSGHFALDEADDGGEDRTGNAAACNLANKRADVDCARGVGK